MKFITLSALQNIVAPAICSVLFLGVTPSVMAGGVALNTTRVIYPMGEKQISVNISNFDKKETFLVQSWVADKDGTTLNNFIITPPLFTLKPEKKNILRIMYIGSALPEDKESIFYLYNKAIPSVIENSRALNTLQIATQSVTKLFVRPKHLSVKPSDAPAMLKCQQSDGVVTVTNPSPYYISMTNFTLAGKKLPNTMVPPMQSQKVNVKGIPQGALSYQTLNDYGALTPALMCKA